MTPRREPPRVVVVGGGFGGLEAVRALAKAPVQVTLVDRRNHHLFQPLLYQVATAALSPAEIAWPLRHILSRQANVEVIMAEAEAVDLDGRTLATSTGPIAYDWLVLATGATHSYFAHPEWAKAAPGLKTLSDATHIRRRVLSAFERAETAQEAEQAALLTFVVVGGGPTGVEMAGAVAELARDALKRDFRRIDPGQARILLVEAGPRILPSFPESLAAYAARTLERIGVEVITGAAVTECDLAGVAIGAERVPAATVVWAAGVAGSKLTAGLAAEHDRAGRVLVGPQLALADHPEVFVIGDAAVTKDRDGKPAPGIAPAAKQAGHYVGRLIGHRLAGRAFDEPYAYRHAGDLATIGRNAAVVKLDRLQLTGFIGWSFWSLAHVYFLIGLRNRVAVALDWFWSWLTRQRSARLIVQDP